MGGERSGEEAWSDRLSAFHCHPTSRCVRSFRPRLTPRSSPPLLLLHGLSSGYGDQVALVWTFLASGVLCPRVAGRQLCGLERLWLSPQIAGSMSVVTLIAIHVVVVTRDH